MSSRQEQLEQQKRMQREERADNAASQQASEMSRRQMEEKLHNPQFAETIRDPDLGRKYEKDLGPDTSKAHAVSNLSEDGERVGSYEVSNALKQLGVDSKGLDALTTATAEHRTVTNERESESNVKNRVKAFFD